MATNLVFREFLNSIRQRLINRGLRRRTARARRLRQPGWSKAVILCESLEDRTLLTDFGDAPLPYPVTIAEGGPQHTESGPTLGATRDGEADGTHSANADADGADEDGVTFGPMRVGQLDATVTVNVQGGSGKLDAWIDFNGDGSWGGPGEQIFDSVSVTTGDNVLSFDVSNYALAGTTFARFRLSSAGDLGVGGSAADGEVEDYEVTISGPASASGVFGGQKTISTAADGADSVFAADVDGDGDIDVLSSSREDDKIAWYENDGDGNFSAHTISTTANGAHSVFAADVDGDGDIDAVSVSTYDNRVTWHENDGAQNFTAHTVSNTANGAFSVFAADVDGDGDTDILSASGGDDKIAWYENDGSQNFTAHTITSAADYAWSVFAADVDGDGDTDVLSASGFDNRIAWYENDGSQNFTTHTISSSANGARSVFACDVDGDGDTDVLSASVNDDRIAWYENDGNENFTTHTISNIADGARSVFAADLDGDGDTDVFSASRFDDKIAWYENDGTESFTLRVISTSAAEAVGVFAADVDGDGDLDVLSASFSDDRIAWYENLNLDFGDAPVPYPTTLAQNGARHEINGPTLGSNRDEEGDGTHSANADADGADEDGVTFGPMRVGQLDATVTVNVQGGSGKLDAWIDFNG
ncbi:MAG: VCBS repeat-containing protein, partial [Planctomycetaceae bacterium]|nr:VCBS repeat-containing protein [Planctomycetaceae bacterium]